jgi:hypothetical protein
MLDTQRGADFGAGLIERVCGGATPSMTPLGVRAQSMEGIRGRGQSGPGGWVKRAGRGIEEGRLTRL